MILGGHRHTIRQVEFMTTILEKQRNQNPLGQWHTPGSRYVFTTEKMNSEPISNVTEADYNYMRGFGYHSWSEYATVWGIEIYIYQEDLAIRSQITNFEQVRGLAGRDTRNHE